MKRPVIYIIAGCNGAGKTTFAKEFLPIYAKCNHFINADLIAQGISPFAPEKAAIKAGRIMLAELSDLLDKKEDFAIESTLSGKTYQKLLRNAKKLGYEVQIFYLWIPAVQLSISRIKQRVKYGGHNVPTPDVRRRFKKSLFNFINLYKPLADYWYFFDNSGNTPQVIAAQTKQNLEIIDEFLYKELFLKSES